MKIFNCCNNEILKFSERYTSIVVFYRKVFFDVYILKYIN